MSQPIQDRFWTKVDKSKECWEWQGGRNKQGYGMIQCDGKSAKAHRVSWELLHGKIPEGIKVLHKCDNPPCVNPDHLFLGTQRDNMQDCSKKGRMNPKDQRGEKHACAVLTNEIVLSMRKFREETGTSFGRIAKIHGVSTMTAYRAIVGQSWGHIS